jgi:hypothetical protein
LEIQTASFGPGPRQNVRQSGKTDDYFTVTALDGSMNVRDWQPLFRTPLNRMRHLAQKEAQKLRQLAQISGQILIPSSDGFGIQTAINKTAGIGYAIRQGESYGKSD